MENLRAYIQAGEIHFEDVPEACKPYGGWALVARFLLDEVPSACDPLGPYNKLLWTPGLLTGHMLSSMDRVSVGRKSPLTSGAKEADTGADHTSGLTICAKAKHTDPEGQVDLSQKAQYCMAGYDSLGACIFGGFGLSAALVRNLINRRYGWGVDDDFLSSLGRE